MRSFILPAAAFVAGCGGAGPGPAASADAAGECTAAALSRMPAGWIETGATVVVTTKGGRPAGIEGHRADGAVHTVPFTPGKEEEAMLGEVCRLGGVGALFPDADPEDAMRVKDSQVALRVVKPSAPSDKTDLDLFCAGPPYPWIAVMDPDPARTLAMHSLTAVLTTPKWRSWLVAQKRRMREAEGPAQDKVYADMVAELRAAGAPEDCWFAKAVLAH
jgi:hypothetical protein